MESVSTLKGKFRCAVTAGILLGPLPRVLKVVLLLPRLTQPPSPGSLIRIGPRRIVFQRWEAQEVATFLSEHLCGQAVWHICRRFSRFCLFIFRLSLLPLALLTPSSPRPVSKGHSFPRTSQTVPPSPLICSPFGDGTHLAPGTPVSSWPLPPASGGWSSVLFDPSQAPLDVPSQLLLQLCRFLLLDQIPMVVLLSEQLLSDTIWAPEVVPEAYMQRWNWFSNLIRCAKLQLPFLLVHQSCEMLTDQVLAPTPGHPSSTCH